jgi:hypothetical protein
VKLALGFVLRHQLRREQFAVEFDGTDAGLPAAVIGRQAVEGCLEVVAEAAALRARVAEVAAQEAKGKLLAQVLGGVGVPDQAAQVAEDRPGVADQKLRLGGLVGRLRPVRLEQQGPPGGDLAQVFLIVARLHRPAAPSPATPAALR